MTDDTKILSAILALHERMIVSPVGEYGRKARHIRTFVQRSRLDVTPLTWYKLTRYSVAAIQSTNMTEDSLAHLQTVAKETLE